jgi:hypothetical protein
MFQKADSNWKKLPTTDLINTRTSFLSVAILYYFVLLNFLKSQPEILARAWQQGCNARKWMRAIITPLSAQL